MVNATQLKSGMAIRFEGQTYRVVAAEYHSGQGKMGGATHARLQNLNTRTFREYSFRPDLKLEDLPIARQTEEFLYSEHNQYCFMNPDSFEQTEVARELVGERGSLLEAGMRVQVEFLEGRPVNVLFPEILEVRIADTAPPSHQQQDGAFKTARLANGVEVMVPQFLKTGDMIRLDVASMKYMDRAKTESRGRGA